VRLEAVVSLGGCPAFDSTRLMRMLCDWLRTGPEHLAVSAAYWLGQAPVDDRALPDLLAALHHPAEEVRKNVVESLIAMSGETPEVLAGLLLAARDSSVRVRRAAAEAFRRPMRVSAVAVPLLLELTADQDQSVRDAAVVALSNLDTVPPAIVPALMNRLEQQDWGIPWLARSLVRAGSPGVERLVPLLQAERPLLRQAAALGLALVVPPADALPGLLTCLNDPEPETRTGAATALGNAGAAAADAVEPLVRLLRDPVWRARAAAAGALGKIGPAALPAVTHLLGALEDREHYVQEAAADSLARLLSLQGEVLSRLTALWYAPEPRLRARAADVLGRISPDAAVLPEAIRVLRRLADDVDQSVQQRAADALKTLAAG
jgi:HEAT repeat protein